MSYPCTPVRALALSLAAIPAARAGKSTASCISSPPHPQTGTVSTQLAALPPGCSIGARSWWSATMSRSVNRFVHLFSSSSPDRNRLNSTRSASSWMLDRGQKLVERDHVEERQPLRASLLLIIPRPEPSQLNSQRFLLDARWGPAAGGARLRRGASRAATQPPWRAGRGWSSPTLQRSISWKTREKGHS